MKPTSQWSNFRASTASVKFHLESATKWILSRISSVTKLDFRLSQDFLCHGIWMENTCVFLIFKHLHFLIHQPAPGLRLTFSGIIFTEITPKVKFWPFYRNDFYWNYSKSQFWNMPKFRNWLQTALLIRTFKLVKLKFEENTQFEVVV